MWISYTIHSTSDFSCFGPKQEKYLNKLVWFQLLDPWIDRTPLHILHSLNSLTTPSYAALTSCHEAQYPLSTYQKKKKKREPIQPQA